MNTKTNFVKFVGKCAINGHSAELREHKETGKLVIRHERHGKHSGLALSFRDQEHFESYIDSKGAQEAQLLNLVLGDLGVNGFPASTQRRA